MKLTRLKTTGTLSEILLCKTRQKSDDMVLDKKRHVNYKEALHFLIAILGSFRSPISIYILIGDLDSHGGFRDQKAKCFHWNFFLSKPCGCKHQLINWSYCDIVI